MTQRSTFRYFKTSPEVIRLAVMLYVRFPRHCQTNQPGPAPSDLPFDCSGIRSMLLG